ncbi:MAG: ABC transporter ATP-binding protein [Actinomycetota bacterium]|nr:ABC transporter ATP-binding protein [Actinomycetota bacterium]
MAPLLEVSDLRVTFAGEVAALRGVSLSLDAGESLAVVGESGAGKSTLGHCLAGLVQPPQVAGSIRLEGRELVGADPEVVRSLRWSTVAIGLQGTPFNPVATVGVQIAEPLTERAGMGRRPARRRAEELADEVLIDPSLLDRYPHELSGGQRRRMMLAMVLALDPRLVVLDEPVAGLDPAGKRALLDRVVELARARGFALVVISHDLPAAAQLATRAMVLYAGEVMEEGPTGEVIGRPAHPYSWALVNAYPRMSTTKDLRPIRGRAPDPRAVPAGCPFHPRCTQAESICVEQPPPLVGSRGRLVACHFGGLKTLLSATGLHKAFRSGGSTVSALADVSLMVGHGESVGVVGASGSGKTTLARILAGHEEADAGEVAIDGAAVSSSWRREARALRRRVQLVAQDPWAALSPRLTVQELVGEPLRIPGTSAAGNGQSEVGEMLDAVGLPASGSFLGARVHELSGGQLQRIALARALIAGPKLLVADEPTSMLDASEQARLLVTLRELQGEMGLGLVLISHDLAIVRKVTDRIVVLDAGRVAEEGPSEQMSSTPATMAARRLIQDAWPSVPAGAAAADRPPVAAGADAAGDDGGEGR